MNQQKSRLFENIENFGTDSGWFGGDFWMVWGYFWDDFGPTLKNKKIESLELTKIHSNYLKYI